MRSGSFCHFGRCPPGEPGFLADMNPSSIPEADVHQLALKLQSDKPFVLLDVREAWELDQAMIVDSRLKVVPMSHLAQLGVDAFPEEVRQRDAEILVLCHHGVRSATVTQWMLAQGWKNVLSVRGGIAEYAQRVDGSVGKY
jgi:rhodanese-related sulfurtransferase